MKRPFKRIICLDFDGVVHSYVSGWKGPRVITDPPVDGALEWMHRALNSGYHVCVFSSRGRYLGGRRAMRKWLRHHAGEGWWFEQMDIGLEDVEFPLFKPPAHITIDDRALTFTGEFPSLGDVDTFKPWNRKAGEGALFGVDPA